MQVIWKRLFSTASGMDGGTLYQLKNLINRRNVVSEPKKDMNACEDFFVLVVEGHIVTAAMTVFDMSSEKDRPSKEVFPEESGSLNKEQRYEVLRLAVDKILDRYVDLSYGDICSQSDDATKKLELDGVQSYASDILSLGLLYMELCDGIREGDGERIIRCWRFLMLIFKASNRTNYSIEAFTLLVQEKFIFSPRMAAQLKFSRTVNTHGRAGKNVPCDLHMEHLNRECKDGLQGLGSNITDKAIKRVGKSVQKTMKVLKAFDEENNIHVNSGYHTKRSVRGDMSKLLNQLLHTSNVFTNRGMSHKTYPSFSRNMMKGVSMDNLRHWMKERMRKLVLFSI